MRKDDDECLGSVPPMLITDEHETPNSLVVVQHDEEGAAGAEYLALVEKAVTETLRQNGNPSGRVEVVLSGDGQLRELNRQFRGFDQPTDVLSFPLEAAEGEPPCPEEETPLLGEIVISVERALQQAGEYGHSPEREVAYLAVHGTLHLLCYGHHNPEEEQKMNRAAERVCIALGLGG